MKQLAFKEHKMGISKYNKIQNKIKEFEKGTIYPVNGNGRTSHYRTFQAYINQKILDNEAIRASRGGIEDAPFGMD